MNYKDKIMFWNLRMPALVFLFSCVCLLMNFSAKKGELNKNGTGKLSSSVVMELFTSEGCSSCPAAEEVTERLVKEYGDNIFLLAFHVDYWDRLGWKDEFSSPAYTLRQQQYMQHFNLSSAYTPQVVINGERECVGSDESKIRKLIDSSHTLTQTNLVEIKASDGGNGKVMVIYKNSSAGKYVLNIALIQLSAANKIKAGENKGLNLKHIDIVRDFYTAMDNAGIAALTLPHGLSTKDCIIVTYLQDKYNMQIFTAKKIEIN